MVKLNTKISSLKTGVIGVGSMGVNHVRILKEISNLVFISDVDELLGHKVSNDYGVKFVNNYSDMLEEVDAIFVVVPTRYHRSVAEDIMDKKIPALIEKPLSDNLDDANFILSGFRRNKVKLCVGHIERYNPVIKKAKEELENNSWGILKSISSRRFSPYPSRITDVGVLFDLAIHDVDLVRHLTSSEVKNVYAKCRKTRNSKYEDYADLKLELTNGLFASCQTSWLSSTKVRDISLRTEKNHIKLDLLNQNIKVFDVTDNLVEVIEIKNEEPLRNEIKDFLSSIVEDRDPLSTGFDGLEAVKIINASIESSNKKRVVNVK